MNLNLSQNVFSLARDRKPTRLPCVNSSSLTFDLSYLRSLTVEASSGQAEETLTVFSHQVAHRRCSYGVVSALNTAEGNNSSPNFHCNKSDLIVFKII